MSLISSFSFSSQKKISYVFTCDINCFFFSFSNLKRFLTSLIMFSSSTIGPCIIMFCVKKMSFFYFKKSIILLKNRFKILVILSNTKILLIRQIIIKMTCTIFMSSNNFFINLFNYIKMSKDSSAKYCQNNKERLKKKTRKRYQKDI